MKKILFLDDETLRVYTYYNSLNWTFINYNTECIEDPNDAILYIQSNHDSIALCICDIMFGVSTKSEYSGIDGGIEFYTTIKLDYPAIPFIILTNRKLIVLPDFRNLVITNNDYIFEKIKTSPDDLVKVVKKIIEL